MRRRQRSAGACRAASFSPMPFAARARASPSPGRSAGAWRKTVEELHVGAGLRGAFHGRGQAAGGGHTLVQERLADTLEHLGRAGLRRLLSRRHRGGDCRRPRRSRLSGHARRPCRTQGAAARAACASPRGCDALQHAAADAGHRVADHPRAVRPAEGDARARASTTSTAWSRRPSGPTPFAMPRSPIRLSRGDLSRVPRRRRGSMRRRRRSTASERAALWAPARTATRSGWAPSTPTASPCRSSSRCSGSSVRGSSCRGPASSGRIAASRFSLDPQSRNPLAPGRKPFHTLNPALARFDDGRTMVYGSMGGDGAAAVPGGGLHAPRPLRHGSRRCDRGAALAARPDVGRPRDDELTMENRFDPDLVAALEQAPGMAC